MSGYVKLYRKIQNHWIWEDPEKFRAWSDLIFMAAYKPQSRLIGGKLIPIPRGGLAASERYLSGRWEWSTTKVRNFLRALELDGMLTLDKKRETTMITLLNYESYNPSESEKEAPRKRQLPEKEAPKEAPADRGNTLGHSELQNTGKLGRSTEKSTEKAPTEANIRIKKEKYSHSLPREASGGGSSAEIPPVSLENAISRGEEMAIHKTVVEQWWLSRDAIGWLRRQQPITNWQSDLAAFNGSYNENSNKQSNGTRKGSDRTRGSGTIGTCNEGKTSQYHGIKSV